ncbi:MAG TPA: hypothetical protein VJV75_07770 [Candidatus Polarisedimenticolia bacterium]|nr:hypothetical protein [Candidatus Polarisedimenticolia bacterium]
MIRTRRAPRSPRSRLERRREAGGLLIVLMVGVTVIFIGLSVAMQSWSVVWRRDSEDELIFRGGQYVLAIVAYQADHSGQYPTDLEILAKEGPRRVRYIRKLFKDPVNPSGQWGLLYLMPGGNAIYDPVAAQRGKSADGTASDALQSGQGGVTPIGDLMGTGLGQQQGVVGTAVPGGAGGAMNSGQTGGQLMGGGQVGAQRGRTGSAAALNQSVGLRGAAVPGLGGQGSFSGGALPPPKPATGTFDEKAPSEPPIGWPIVGVISRADDRISAKTFKIYKGHDKLNEWQFHVFDGSLIPTTPQGLPGGSQAPFSVGPGFGGKGRGGIFGQGPGGGRGGNNTPPQLGGPRNGPSQYGGPSKPGGGN